jgi:hypothetical protein
MNTRLPALSGVVFGVSGLAAFAISQAGPGASSPGRPVIDFYVAHRNDALASDVVWGLAFAFFLLFAACFREHLQARRGDPRLSNACFAAAAVTAAGAGVYFGCDAVLAATPATLTPPAAQALNVIALKLFLPVAVGGLTFGVTAGLAAARARALPRWLSWAGVVAGLSFASPLGVFAIVLLLVWSGITGIYLFRGRPAEATA